MSQQAVRHAPAGDPPPHAQTPPPGLAPTWPAVAVYLAVVLAFVGLILAGNDGVFSYALDDPYIHLEFARHLAQGEHGIHPGEFSAPSSSMLWPLLLVPGWWLGGALYLPLVLNVGAGLLALAALGAAARRVLADEVPWRTTALVLVGLILVTNVVALTFAGMEHTLQVALAAWLAVGLMDVDAGRRPAGWLVLVAVLLPLLRFECTGIVLLSAAWLVVRGHRAQGVAIAAAVVAIIGGYCAYIHANSGFWLPFSVLSKNDMFLRAWQEPWLPVVFLPVLLAGGMMWRAWSRPWSERLLPAIAAAGIAGHVAIAQVGIFHRYMGYVTVFVVLVVAWSERRVLRDALRAGGEKARIVGWVVLILAVVNAKMTWAVVGYAGHIWRQQGQLARITTEVVDGPVAVNDIGWVSYESDHYVVDLVGLASAEALRHKLAGDPVGWMDDLVREKGARAVMIFPHWFEEVPPAWVHVATLVVDQTVVQGPDRVVLILSPDAAGVEGLRAGLEAFEPTLPQGVRLQIERGG